MQKFVVCLFLIGAAFAQKNPITLETLSQAGRGGRGGRGGFDGPQVWMPDGKSFLFRQGRNLMAYDPATKSSKLLMSLEALDAAAVKPPDEEGAMDWTNRRAGRGGGIALSAGGKELLYNSNGDLFLIHLDTAKWDQLTATPAREMDGVLSPDGKAVAFHRGLDLYVLDVASKKETRLTTGGSETLRNGTLDWVYPEELSLSTAFWWSPDSKSIAYLQFDTSQEPMYPHEDVLKTRALYEPERYPQAGENNAAVRLGVVPATGGATHWYDVGDTRDNYLIARAGWMPGSRALYVLRLNRVQNHNEMLAIDVESGARSTIFTESDPYWINLHGDIQFLGDGKSFLWTSERGDGGYRHIFMYSNDGKQMHQITKGAWEVTGIDGVDEEAKRIFYTSDEPSHLEQHLYSIGFDGQNKRQLTKEPGTHMISMGPGGKYYIDTWSSLTEPSRSVLHSGDGTELGVYHEPDRRQTNEYDILPTEIVNFKTPDGVTLYGRLIKPPGYQAGKKYPVVISVYGGPGVGLPVHNSWQGITIDQVLAHKGYVVWQSENRGGVGRGHAFEAAIYHKLGVTELADQVAGVKYLIAQGIADPERIGIHGWSYGGFMTANAMLNAPDVFKAGFSGAPVTSWMNYDTIYTERYMGLPKDNPDGYRDTALPPKAKNLKGKLMLVHNFEDDNVLFQNSLQLTSALQLAGKQFEYMLYPQKSHGVTGPASQQMNQMMLDFFDRALQ
ncbi:MAG TPA: S9 family peptidase [Bryobacteraceae bacterium]|nr:S9 family peptidase [Bryobacteraceae bacterium]